MKSKADEAMEKLYDRYGGRRGPWGQHPEYMLDMWHAYVNAGRTDLGYWAWVLENILDETPEEDDRYIEKDVQTSLVDISDLRLDVDEDEEWFLEEDGYPRPEDGYDGYDGEHERYSRDIWLEEVNCDDTRRGYWAWVATMIRDEDD